MEKLRLFFLYLYLFSLTIENWSPWGSSTDLLRPALIFAMLYVVFSLFQFSENFSLKHSKTLVIPAFILWALMTASSIINTIVLSEVQFSLNYTLFACIVSFWLISNDLRRYANLKNNFIIILLLNGIFLSIMSYFHIGIDVSHMGRESLLGNNPNVIGISAVISLLIIIVFIIDNPLKHSRLRLLLLLFAPMLLQVMAKTGSKGALVLLLSGFIFYFIHLKKPLKFKIPIISISTIILLFSFNYLLQNEVFSARWAGFVETGDTTGRSERWIFAIEAFLNSPVYGFSENGYENLPSPFYGSNEPHNVYLYVLATGGLISFIPFSLFLKRVLFRAYNNRSIWNHAFPVVLLLILLMYWFKAGGGLNSKLVWALFALISYNGEIYYDKTRTNENSHT